MSSALPYWNLPEQRGNDDLVDLAQQIAEEILSKALPDPARQFDLAAGTLGIALFLAHLSKFRDSRRYRYLATTMHEEALHGVSRATSLVPGLYSGLAGVEWCSSQIASLLELRDFQAPDIYLSTYEAIADYLHDSREFEFDLINGLTGIGLWALTIAPLEWRHRFTLRVVELLQAAARVDSHGTMWATPSNRRTWRRTDPSSAPELNLGVAHGTPGVVGFLAKCVLGGVGPACTRDLLSSAMDWLRAQASPESAESVYTYAVGDNRPARLAWCYGDAGVACALHLGAMALRSADTKAFADYVTLRAARRPPDTAGVTDACLCHGTAGLTHICAQLAAVTGFRELEAARLHWLRFLIDARGTQNGICGLPFLNTLTGKFEPRGALLDGAAGVGLVLLSQTATPPRWDWPLLVG